MKILISCRVLDVSGTPIYTLTLYNELKRRGHEIVVYSPLGGKLARQMETVSNLNVDKPDVIMAQMNMCADEMRAVFPSVPMMFLSHGIIPTTEQAPQHPMDWYVAINEDVRDNLILQGVSERQISIVRDFVDTTQFAPKELVGQQLKRVLYISNYKKWRTYARIAKCCDVTGIELKAIGSPYGRSLRVYEEINRADMVISTGRGVLEAMACGRPVLSFDKMNGDGYLTPDIYLESRRRNFFGSACRYTFEDYRDLLTEMKKYNCEDGLVNRELALVHHDSRSGVDRLLEIAETIM